MIRQLESSEILLAVGGAAAASCSCRRCRDMDRLKEDLVDLVKGLWDGFVEEF